MGDIVELSENNSPARVCRADWGGWRVTLWGGYVPRVCVMERVLERKTCLVWDFGDGYLPWSTIGALDTLPNVKWGVVVSRGREIEIVSYLLSFSVQS